MSTHAAHPSDPGPDQKLAKVKEAFQTLMEHFDCAQFLGSYVGDDRQTRFIYYGEGNLFGRQGMATHWLAQDLAATQAMELKNVLPQNPPEDGEEWKHEE